jgi:DNA-binding beta-propeller fold protein YncE
VSLGLLSGCGNAYRATVGTNNPVPVPTQPIYLPVVTSSAGTISSTGAVTLTDAQGLATILDLAGDSTLVQVNLGIQPIALALGSGGTQAYSVNLGSLNAPYTQGSVSEFGVVQNLQTSQVTTTSLNNGTGVFSQPSTLTTLNTPQTPCTQTSPAPAVFANSSLIYVSQTTGNNLLPLSRNISGNGVPALLPPLATAGTIRAFTGLTTTTHTFAIEDGENGGTAGVEVIDFNSNTGMPYITPTPGITPADFSSPTFGVTSYNGQRVFVLNCNGTVTALDAQANAYISTIPIEPTTAPGGVAVPAGNPIWGDYVNNYDLLVTANTNGAPAAVGTGTPGSVSFIDATQGSPAFGTTLGTAAVGVNPSGIVALQDDSYAYVVNEGDDVTNTTTTGLAGGTPVNCGGCKTVSIVSLTSFSTVATIPLYYSDSTITASCPASVGSATGYPSQIIASPDTTDQKVYVLCDQPSGDTFYVFAIRTFPQNILPGETSPGNQVTAVIPIEGIPTQMRLTPAR